VGRFSALIRISAGLVLLTCMILLTLDMLGLVPAPADERLQTRVRLGQTLAAQAAATSGSDLGPLRAALAVAVQQNEEMLSAGLRDTQGRLLVTSADHRLLWSPDSPDRSTSTHVRVPLFRGPERWATLELRFERAGPDNVLQALWERPLIRTLLMLGAAGFFAYLFFMRRTLRHLDPSAVIPARVQTALDVMAEGVLLLDQKERIVLANAEFSKQLDRSPASLLGVQASSLGWRLRDGSGSPQSIPWLDAMRDSQTVKGVPLSVELQSGEQLVFSVNASPVLDGWGRAKGAIVTFDDVTELEQKSSELQEALTELEESRDEVRAQYEELQVMARTDPLTGLSNRRAFLERLEAQLAAAKREEQELCCVMVDIEHLKRLNYAHGLAAGDEVLRRVAEVVRAAAGSADDACRCGGGEFCLAFPDMAADDAAHVAAELRRRVQSPGFARQAVRIRCGISSTAFGATTAEELMRQAGSALHASKGADGE
jgi:diguanylate cyclase (GGDEF)-like protein